MRLAPVVAVSTLTLAGFGWAADAVRPSAGEPPEIIVSTPRGQTSGGVDPLIVLTPSELDSYGADTLSDLVDALRPLTRSSRSDQMAVVLINGRLAGQTEFDTLPREAIERVEVLPESVALQYGFSENQRVLNFVLREHFRAVPVRLSDSGATEGGSQSAAADASLVRLDDEARVTLLGSYKDSAWLRESDRGIELPDSYFRTLQPDKTDAKIAGTLSRAVLGLSASAEASYEVVSAKSLQGAVDLGTEPGGGSLVPLEQSAPTRTARIATQLTGQLKDFVWGATAYYMHVGSRSSSDTGAGTGVGTGAGTGVGSGAGTVAGAGASAGVGSGASAGVGTGVGAAGNLLVDRSESAFDAGNLQLSASGRIARLPAGAVLANIKLAFQYQGFDTQDAFPGAALTRSNLVRTIRSGSVNASLPIADRDRGVLPALGELSATLNATLDNVSQFGTLLGASYGIDWHPIKMLHVDAIYTDHRTAPTVQQLRAPPVVTPNVEMFDFITGQTAYVTQITGGDGTLAATDSRQSSFGAAIGPFAGKTTFLAHYEQSRSRNAIGALPPTTAAVEQAFPDRYLRDADGNLIEVDDRWVNLARQSSDDLKWGVNVWIPLGESGPRAMANRVEFSLFDTWYLHDVTLIRDGIPELDLLDGAPSDVAGGQPRHKIEFHTLVHKNGFGVLLAAAWRSPTTVDSGEPGAPDPIGFSALATADLRVFADCERLPLTRNLAWSKGTRFSVAVTNLADTRQRVRDATGATPTAFLPGYLDPPGRVIAISARKLF